MQKLTSNESKILNMSDEDILKSLNLILKSNYPMIYKKNITKITGSIPSSLVLSQLMDWNKCMKGKELCKTNDEFCEELCMNINEFKAAKKRLIDKEFISVRLKGCPRKTYYTINVEKIYEALSNETKIEQNQQVNKKSLPG